VLRRKLKGGADSARPKEVNTIPMQVDLRVHDNVALDEIELYTDVLAAAPKGLRLRSAPDRAYSPGRRYITSVDQSSKPSAVYILTAAVLSSST
jgi:hypothetical protein